MERGSHFYIKLESWGVVGNSVNCSKGEKKVFKELLCWIDIGVVPVVCDQRIFLTWPLDMKKPYISVSSVYMGLI